MGRQVLKEDLEETPMAEGEQLNPLGGVSRTSAHDRRVPCSGPGLISGWSSLRAPGVHLQVFSRLGQVPRALGTPVGPSEDCAKVGTKGSLKRGGEKL